MKGKGGFWEVFNWRTGEVVSSFDSKDEAIEDAVERGDDYDYAREDEG